MKLLFFLPTCLLVICGMQVNSSTPNSKLKHDLKNLGQNNQQGGVLKPDTALLDSLNPQPEPLTLDERFIVKANGAVKLKEYLNALTLRQQLQAEGEFPEVYPTSAGIYTNGKLDVMSLSGYEQSLQLYRRLSDVKGEALILNAFGTYYGMQGDLDKSVQYFKEALQIKEVLNDKAGIAKTSINLARILKFKGSYDEAIRYNEDVIRLSTAAKKYNRVALALAEISELKFMQQKYSEAETLILKKALPMFYYRLKDKVGSINCFDQLARIYEKQKRFSEAKWFYIQANTLARKINNNQGIITSLINMGHVKNAIGDHDLALRDYKEAEELATRYNYPTKMVEIKGGLGETYRNMKNTAAASTALEEYTHLTENLLSAGK